MTDYPTALAAALDAQKPSGFAYRYRDALAGGTVIRFNSGHEVNGSRPIAAVPYWLGAPPAPVALTVLQDLSERFSAMHANGDVWITSVAAAKMAQTAATQAQQPATAVSEVLCTCCGRSTTHRGSICYSCTLSSILGAANKENNNE